MLELHRTQGSLIERATISNPIVVGVGWVKLTDKKKQASIKSHQLKGG